MLRYAKTLYKPERPNHINKLISKYTKSALPHFFKYAKDKDEYQVEEINKSFVNKLNGIIPNPRINCRKVGLNNIDYKLLMNNPDIECKVEFTDKGKLIKEKTDPLITKYYELNKKYGYTMNNVKNIEKSLSYEVLKNSKSKQDLKHRKIYEDIKSELSLFGYSDIEITDILVKYLYEIKKSKHKSILWICYGDYILENIKKHFRPQTKTIQCIDCGKWFEVDRSCKRTIRCPECQDDKNKSIKRDWWKDNKS